MSRRRGLGPVLLISGAAGFFLGLGQATWHEPVESAQILAGIVAESPQYPFYISNLRIWSAVHQILALLLKLGFLERSLCLLLSGLTGMLSFQALAAVAYAVCGDAPLSIGAPFLIHLANLGSLGVCYPVWLMGAPQSDGVLGLSFALLVIGLLGAGWWRSGLFLLMLAPGVHPFLGLFLWLAIAIALAADWRRARRLLSRVIAWPAAGGALLSASWAAHAAMAGELPKSSPFQARRYLLAFVENWDAHRWSPDFNLGGLWFGLAVTVACALCLRATRKSLGRRRAFALKATGVAGALGCALACVGWLPAASLPTWLIQAMPARYINVATLASLPLSLALLRVWTQRRAPALAAGAKILLAAAVAAVIVRDHAYRRWGLNVLRGRINDPFYLVVGRRPGFLLTAGNLHLIQARTRRAVILQAAILDRPVPYAPAAAAETERILRLGYGIELMNPPAEIRANHPGGLLPESGRGLWEARTPEQWKQVGRQLGVSDVLCPVGWRIKLPLVGAGDGLALYSIGA